MKEWVRKAQRGDGEAFMQLFSTCEEEMYRIAFLNVKNEADALDVMQESAYRAFKSIKHLKKPEYFKTWLMRIVMNCAMDHIRKNSKEIQSESDYIENAKVLPVSHEKELILQFTLKEMMDILEAPEKNVIILKYYYEYSFKEIADILQKPLGSVKTILYRALGKLREKAEKEGLYEEGHRSGME